MATTNKTYLPIKWDMPKLTAVFYQLWILEAIREAQLRQFQLGAIPPPNDDLPAPDHVIEKGVISGNGAN